MSIIRRRAAASSQASGACGTPRVGQLASAAAKPSQSASSAAATSPVRARGEAGYELAIALPCRVFGRTMRGCGIGHIIQIGRTSTVP
jgi:hypothetical protein